MLRQYHEVIGESGFSPYEIIFGPYRNLPGVPQYFPAGSADAQAFFDRQDRIDEAVARILNNKHDKVVERVNRDRPARPPFDIGTKVWVYKHKKVGGYRLEPRWWGPAEVIARTGSSSYTIDFEGDTEEVHIDDLKEYLAEDLEELEEELQYFEDSGSGDGDEGSKKAVVEKIVAHRKNSLGRLEFLVKWAGYDNSHNTWEYPGNLFRCPWGLMSYCCQHCLVLDGLDMMPHLQ